MLSDLLNGGIKSIEYFVVSLLSILFVIFCTMPVHEAAHAYIAHKLGDNTAKSFGRLTLNPIKHINYLGALLLLAFGFGWAEPVPVNQWNLRKPKRDMALIAAAGPISNILMAIVLMIMVNIVDYVSGFYGIEIVADINVIYYSGASDLTFKIFYYVIVFLSTAANINLYLAAFNLIPIPPLDGSRIIGAFLPNRIYYKLQSFEQYTFVIVIALAATGVLSSTIGFISDNVYNVIDYIVTLPFSIFDATLPFHNVV
ncbi:MAG: site-2 protease family protein [Clostridia bacterium]|nr:site-2 protease family protein [Clostridia bacterium]